MGIPEDQVRQMIASFAVDPRWSEIDADLRTFLDLPPKERGRRFGIFLLSCRAGEAVEEIVVFELPPVETIVSRICVDRSIWSAYPNWVRDALNPGLEKTGPGEFNADELDQWLHPEQVSGAKGQVIYEHLRDNDMLSSCLSLRDLEEIQKKGISFFRKYWQSKSVFAWKTVVVKRSGGSLRVPFLFARGKNVLLGWRWLENSWGVKDIALRFKNI